MAVCHLSAPRPGGSLLFAVLRRQDGALVPPCVRISIQALKVLLAAVVVGNMVSWGAEDLVMTQSRGKKTELGFARWLGGHSGALLAALSWWWVGMLTVSWSAGLEILNLFLLLCVFY